MFTHSLFFRLLTESLVKGCLIVSKGSAKFNPERKVKKKYQKIRIN